MAAAPRMFPSSPPGDVEGVGGTQPPGGLPTDMEILRRFVNQRLTAAVDDILGEVGRTVARYREQIDMQRRQLNGMKSGEGERSSAAELLLVSSWIKSDPDHQDQLIYEDHEVHQDHQIQQDLNVQSNGTEETDAGSSATRIKTEGGSGENCGWSEPEPEADGHFMAEHSDTEDSGDDWRDAAAPEAETQSSGSEVKSRHDSSQEHRLPLPGFGCRVCGESFSRMTDLLTHTSAHLRDCSVCGKHLEHGESLKLHLRVHREMAFCCGVCGQSFTLRGNLRTHMRIHSGERPFGCDVCGKSFGRRATLVRHVRSHTGEKPFTCTYCGHGFVEKGNLTVHLRTHTGERPYGCSVCDRRFSQLSCFYKHPCYRTGLVSVPANPS